MQTLVVNLNKSEYDVYIGRSGKGNYKGQEGYFGNPFKHTNRDIAIKFFKDYFYNRIETDPEFKEEVLKLKGKKLGCYCKPKSCHGDIIAEYLNGITE